jgi:FdhD protein
MKSCKITKYYKQNFCPEADIIAIESLLSIEIIWGQFYNRTRTHLADLLRTPGHDYELALGLLFSLGIIKFSEDIIDYSLCTKALLDPQKPARIVLELASHIFFKPQNFSPASLRHAGCGMCTSPQEIPQVPALNLDTFELISAQTLLSCAQKLKPAQKIFNKTGGTHAAALFDMHGTLQGLYEDVGRHNALDKLIGFSLKLKNTNLNQALVLMSSRASYELIQKAHMAQIPLIATLGAVSTRARDYAEEFNITLVGFLRQDSFNIYTHSHRIAQSYREHA